MPKENPMLTEEDYNSDFFTGAMAKKGGRIRKTKKGGRAVRKANRSKKKYKGFSKLPETVQIKINKKLAKKV